MIDTLSLTQQISQLAMLEKQLKTTTHIANPKINSHQGITSQLKKTTSAKALPSMVRRLCQWGEWQLQQRETQQQSLYGNSFLGRLIDSHGEIIRATCSDKQSMPDRIYDTDRAVMQLSDDLKSAVWAQYVEIDLTSYEKASICKCSIRTLQRRVIKAQHAVYALIKIK